MTCRAVKAWCTTIVCCMLGATAQAAVPESQTWEFNTIDEKASSGSELYQTRHTIHVPDMTAQGVAFFGLKAGTDGVLYGAAFQASVMQASTEEGGSGPQAIWNPFSASLASGCLFSGCGGSGCLGSACFGSGCFGSGCTQSVCGGSACAGSGCVGSVCAGSACGGSVCGGSACVLSACGGSVCIGSVCMGSVCAGSGCGVSVCGGSFCGESLCAGSVCVISACGGSVCLGSACLESSCLTSACRESTCAGSRYCTEPTPRTHDGLAEPARPKHGNLNLQTPLSDLPVWSPAHSSATVVVQMAHAGEAATFVGA